MSGSPNRFENVTAVAKANLFFDGKVASHTILFPDGSRKSLGLAWPGTFRFDTGAPEVMEIVSGSCRARLAGEEDWKEYGAGSSFRVPGSSSFEMVVESGVAEYVCSFG
jgi:uncharacterized protein YaiE (UPF0345 family)